MRPSAVRARIQREHQQLRELLSQLEAYVSALTVEPPGDLDAVLTHARLLSLRLTEHVDLEDALLAPALRATDAWGEQRAIELVTHHVAQRREISGLLDTLERLSRQPDATAQATLAGTLRGFAAELELDMRHEDAALLHPDLLRDDVVGIAVEGG
jgi:hemerythrin-like domain-containing protein